MNSWKTTSAGILTILGAAVTVWFHRAALTPELIMGAATAAMTGLGLILARDNDKSSEDVGAKPAPADSASSGAARGPLMLLCLVALLLGAVLTGCQAPPQRIAYDLVAAPAMTSDHAMQIWGDYVSQQKQSGHPVSLDQERQVLAAYRKCKAAELAAIDAAHLAANSMGSTNSITSQLQSPAASQALSDLVAVIRQFGGNL